MSCLVLPCRGNVKLYNTANEGNGDSNTSDRGGPTTVNTAEGTGTPLPAEHKPSSALQEGGKMKSGSLNTTGARRWLCWRDHN